MKAPYRVVLSEQTTANLRSLTQKTGLSANILSRFAMLISFEDLTPPAVDAGKGLLTINRTTLFGELEPFLMATYSLIIRNEGGNAGRSIADHIARGAAYLNVRVESIPDFLAVVNDLS
jgi:DNA sulfur modification protein DndE